MPVQKLLARMALLAAVNGPRLHGTPKRVRQKVAQKRSRLVEKNRGLKDDVVVRRVSRHGPKIAARRAAKIVRVLAASLLRSVLRVRIVRSAKRRPPPPLPAAVMTIRTGRNWTNGFGTINRLTRNKRQPLQS